MLRDRQRDRMTLPGRLDPMTIATAAQLAPPAQDVWIQTSNGDDGDDKTGTYVAIGAGALALGALAYFMIKKKGGRRRRR